MEHSAARAAGRSAGPWASLRDHAGDAEFRRYAGYNSSQLHTPHVELTCDRHNHEGFIESVLRPALAPHNATALLRVRIGGYLPRPAEMLRRHGAEAAALPDACLSRYVTEPRFPARPRLADTPAATTAVHLRTGFADAEDAMAAGVRASAAGTARWVRAACGDDPFGDGTPRLVVTDAPGIARHFAARYPTAVVGASALPPNQTTRSWWATLEMKFATLDDIVAAGRARTLRVAPQRMVGRRAKIEEGKGAGPRAVLGLLPADRRALDVPHLGRILGARVPALGGCLRPRPAVVPERARAAAQARRRRRAPQRRARSACARAPSAASTITCARRWRRSARAATRASWAAT